MSGLPESVRDLIARHFDSAESIEIVVLLRRSPETFWSAAAAAQKLGFGEDLTRRKLQKLADSRILARADGTAAFRYAPADDVLRRDIDELVDCYASRRLAVIHTIYSANAGVSRGGEAENRGV